MKTKFLASAKVGTTRAPRPLTRSLTHPLTYSLMLLALIALGYSTRAATGPASKTAVATPTGGTRAAGSPASGASGTASTDSVAVVIRKSVFQNDLKDGKDPFFPKSTRRGPKTPEATAQIATPLVNLVLKGITGPPKRRFALINNQTLSAGEIASVRIANGQIKVHCLEIRDDSVIILIEGNPEQKELRLRGQ